MSIETVAAVFGEFADNLDRKRSEDITLIAEAGNGFEGWVKLEFYRWLRHQDLSPDDVGLEYRLNRARPGHEEKRYDLWFRSPRTKGFHYVEIKVPFANANAGKMLRLAGDDFRHMMHIDAEHELAASGNAILLGVNFTSEDWKDGRRRVRDASAIDPSREPANHGVICNKLYWDVWTHSYPQ